MEADSGASRRPFCAGFASTWGGAARCLGATPLARGVTCRNVIYSGSHDTKKIHIKIQEVVELFTARDISSRLTQGHRVRGTRRWRVDKTARLDATQNK